jgi:hypothetical protein
MTPKFYLCLFTQAKTNANEEPWQTYPCVEHQAPINFQVANDFLIYFVFCLDSVSFITPTNIILNLLIYFKMPDEMVRRVKW